jgi:hypothetical protein
MEKKKEHDYQEGVSSQNKYGEWVPAIPEPYWRGFGLRKAQCTTCVEQPVFKDIGAYRGHYALVHILGL